MNKPAISIILVNYQSAALLRRFFESFQPALSMAPRHEFIIVNNDVAESALINDLARTFGVEVKELGANYGFSRANNVGAEMARGEILFFLNPDTEYRRGQVSSLCAIFSSHPNAIIGATLESQDGQEERWSWGNKPTLPGLFFGKIWKPVRLPTTSKTVIRTDWVSGAALALRRETFHKIGGFDENFFLYYEDVDLCLRGRALGCPIFHFPFLSFFHSKGKSHPSHQSMKAHYFEGQKIFFKKHGRSFEYSLLLRLQPLYQFLTS